MQRQRVSTNELSDLTAALERIWRRFGISRDADRAIANATRLQVEAVRAAYGDVRVVSLGNHCYTSQMLSNWGLKRASLPFDWIFSNNAMIAHCIADDFQTFLKPSYFRTISSDLRASKHTNKCDHVFYRDNFGLLNVFNHRDPTSPKDFAYYERCVDRFRALYRELRPTVFVLTFWDLGAARADFFRLEEALRAKVDRFLLVGAAIRETGGARPSCVPVSTGGRHILLEMASQSRMLDLRFEAMADDIVLGNGICSALLEHHARARDE